MSGRKPIEESMGEVDALDTSIDARTEALALLTLGAARDETARVVAMDTPAVVPSGEPEKWDGTTEYLVTGGAFTAVVDGDYRMARTGKVLLLAEKTGTRGVDLGVLEKA